MDSLDQLLEGLRTVGQTESTGAFTIDFARAREKLARFQLGEPELFVLKFVQAAVLAAQHLSITSRKDQLRFLFHGWDGVGLEGVGQRFCSILDNTFHDACGCLTIGLNAALALKPRSLTASRFEKGERRGEWVSLGDDWELQVAERDARAGLEACLVVSIDEPAGLDLERFERALLTRCAYAPIDILLNGESLGEKAGPPPSLGRHRGIYFRDNRILSEFRLQTEDPAFTVPATPATALVANWVPGERHSWLLFGVDFDPMACLFLVKSGVVVDSQRVELDTPGLLAVVEADDLETDLTGLQIRQDQDYQSLVGWLDQITLQPLEQTIEAVCALSSERQPTSGSAPMHPISTTLSWGTLLGCLSSLAWAGPKLGVILTAGFWFWPPAVALLSGWILGYERDAHSDQMARGEVLEVLRSAFGRKQKRLRP
ncbi:MAG: hypothetical protein KC910_28890 [Candidatus Eremiobacteraeota bacterium]|nr:hypothetical protein [Candidatus Eremiobacteraeota bacterium]